MQESFVGLVLRLSVRFAAGRKDPALRIANISYLATSRLADTHKRAWMAVYTS